MKDVGNNKKKNDHISKEKYQCGDEETSASKREKRKEASKNVSFNLHNKPKCILLVTQIHNIQERYINPGPVDNDQTLPEAQDADSNNSGQVNASDKADNMEVVQHDAAIMHELESSQSGGNNLAAGGNDAAAGIAPDKRGMESSEYASGINADTKAGGNETHRVVVVPKNDAIYETYY